MSSVYVNTREKPPVNQRLEHVKSLVDWSAVAVGIGVFADVLPKIVGVFTLIWLGMQMWTWLVNKSWRRETK